MAKEPTQRPVEVTRPATRLNKPPTDLEDRIVFTGMSRVAAKAFLAKLPADVQAKLTSASPEEFYGLLNATRASVARSRAAEAELRRVNRGPDGSPLPKEKTAEPETGPVEEKN